MKKNNNYLNGILTVIALLLGGLLWTQVAENSGFAQTATAQSRTRTSHQTLIPNAAEQRVRIIDGLSQVEKSIAEVNRSLQRGEFAVRVTNLSEIPTSSDGRRSR